MHTHCSFNQSQSSSWVSGNWNKGEQQTRRSHGRRGSRRFVTVTGERWQRKAFYLEWGWRKSRSVRTNTTGRDWIEEEQRGGDPESKSHQVDWRAQGESATWRGGGCRVRRRRTKMYAGARVTTHRCSLHPALIRRSVLSACVEEKQVPDMRDGGYGSVME